MKSILLHYFAVIGLLELSGNVLGINIVENVGHAQSYGQGGYSQSDAFSNGVKVGILYPGGNYRPISEQTNAYTNSFSTGRRPPYTFAKTSAGVGANFAKGNVAAGYRGGQGQTNSQSKAQQIAIPLGFGATLLSNLPTSSNETVVPKNSSENALKDKSKVVQVPLQSEKPRKDTVTPTAASSPTTNNRLIFN